MIAHHNDKCVLCSVYNVKRQKLSPVRSSLAAKRYEPIMTSQGTNGIAYYNFTSAFSLVTASLATKRQKLAHKAIRLKENRRPISLLTADCKLAY